MFTTPLECAVNSNSVMAVELLLQYGANPNFTPGLCSPIRLVKSPEILKLLFKYGVDVGENFYNDLLEGRYDLIKTRIDHGLDFEEAVRLNLIKKHHLIRILIQNLKVTELLLEKCRGIFTSFYPTIILDGRKPIEIVNDIINLMGNINSRDIHVKTLLYYVQDVEVAKILVERGSAFNNKSQLILSGAALRGDLEMVRFLIEMGAEVNRNDRYSMYQYETPLHRAINGNHLDMVKLLYANGADINDKAFIDMTPLSYAKYKGFKEILEFLENVGAEN